MGLPAWSAQTRTRTRARARARARALSQSHAQVQTQAPTPARDERGAGSVLGVAIIAGLICLTALVVPLYIVLATKQSLAGAADAAALAAADTRVGLVAGEPCAVAARVAAANRGDLTACRLDGLVVTVTVSGSVAGFAVGVSATAGPPPISGNKGVE